MILVHVFCLLCFGHVLADQPLQNEYITRAKRGLIEGCPAWYGLLLHSTVHAGLVLLFTGSVVLFMAEAAMHFAIDRAKCRGIIGLKEDQRCTLFARLFGCWRYRSWEGTDVRE